MKAKLRKIFSNRWVLAALGLLLLSIVIWFVGDALAFYDYRPLGTKTRRALLILLVILAWAASEGWKAYRAWRANRQMLAALAEGETPDRALSAREIAELKQRFEQAVATLKKARFANRFTGGGNYLYQLPWYLFIGAPGSGKTTALVNSGLRFPLADELGKGAVRGVGGTRNCDWWFTDEAVLLDSAGRYTTQSSNRDVDNAAWLGFLKLLRKFRPQQPLNGAFITLSVSDLLGQSPAERKAYAHAVHQRIQELYKHTGCRFPLYVIVTKCDLLAGFTEFFADLNREDRAQVWGATFPYHPGAGADSPLAQFGKEFAALSERLGARLYARLENESDSQRRAQIAAFPQQFASLKSLIGGFLQEVFGNSPFEEQAMFRGFYFTSGTQEGSPIDRVLGNLARNFNLGGRVLPPAANTGKSYFVTRLLRDVVFAESDLTGANARIASRQRKVLLGAYSATAVVTILLIAGWIVSYFRNQGLVQEVSASLLALDSEVRQLAPPGQRDYIQLLPVLNAARNLPAGYAARAMDVPFTLGLGLYQGDKLGAGAQTAYMRLLRDSLLPLVASDLDEQIRNARSADVRYEALKSYLMLYDDKHLDAEAFEAWINANWQRALPADLADTGRNELGGHLHAALTQRPLELIVSADRELVASAQRSLASLTLAQRVFSRLKLAGQGAEIPPFRISEAAGPSAPLVLVRASGKPLSEGIAGAYTVSGYRGSFGSEADEIVQQLADEEAWVLGSHYAGAARPPGDRVLAEVKRLYLADYIRVWDELLTDIRVIPSRNLEESIQGLSVLSGADSPLTKLMVAAARETKLSPSQTPAEAAAQQAGSQVMARMRQTVDRILGDAPMTQAHAAAATPEAYVDKHFEPLHRLVTAPSGAPAPFDEVIALLKEYEVHLRATDEAVRRGAPPPPDAMMIARLKSAAAQLPPPARNMIESLVSRATTQTATVTQQGLAKALSGGVGRFCQQAIAGRYPFDRNSTRDVALGDFARLFGSGGQIDQFYQTNLQNYVDISGTTWRPIGLADGVSSVSQGTVTQFQRASIIREAFFSRGTPNPSVSAELQLISLDKGLKEVQLVNDGQVTRFFAGQVATARLEWPSLSAGNQIQLTGIGSKGIGRKFRATISTDGAWALFRLHDLGRVEGTQSDRYRLVYVFEGHKATFELRAYSIRNPFRLRELGLFRCPI